MRHRWFLVVSALGVAVAAFFLVRSLDDDLVYYLYTSEAVSRRADFPDGRRFRLAGIVQPGSLVTAEEGMEFTVGDGAAAVPVRLTATAPPLFREDVPVLLEGAWQGEVFVADEALVRHESGYEAPATGNAPSG